MSIDYMLPAEVNFPPSLKRVGVVNNAPVTPDNHFIVKEKETQKEIGNETFHQTRYFNGESQVTTEALAEALAKGNYFDEVVICDSALRMNDSTPHENILNREEVNQLAKQLDVDCLISLENIQLKEVRKIQFLPEWRIYQGTVDVKVYPTIRIYIPNRNGPMVTLRTSDSIFWEKEDYSKSYVRSKLISDKEMLQQSSDFAGNIPVNHLLPYWKTDTRYYFTGGSANMRDAAVYIKEKNWEGAIKLWKQTYESKTGKQKMYAAYNIALGYEMQDSIETAKDWATKAQKVAIKIDKVDNKMGQELIPDIVPNYLFTTRYLGELQTREENLSQLKIQMQRFNSDF